MKTHLFFAVATVALVCALSLVVEFWRTRKLPRSQEKPKKPEIGPLQREREHIESLFADRINFYLVFAAGILLFVFDKPHDEALLKFALLIIVIVSGLMLVALLRTFLLVRAVLHDIERYPDEPYTQYSQGLKWLPNANDLLLFLPISITVFFVYALIKVWQDFPELPNN